MRSNALVPNYYADITISDSYFVANGCYCSLMTNYENTSTESRGISEGYRPCVFTYNGITYAGLEFYQTQAASFTWTGISEPKSFVPFKVAYYNTNTKAIINEEINNSLIYTSPNVNIVNMKIKGTLSGLTSTITELNYCGGVISNIQTQLNSKLNLSGGTMSGNLTFASTKGIKYAAGESDTQLWQVYDNSGAYGYALQYNGSGSGNENTLVLISDNQSGTKVNAVTMKQDGTTTFAKAITASGGIIGNASTATTASKVANKLTIKLNGGSTEGTNLFTFDGSAAKTLNITASSIGAAPAYTYQTSDPGAGSSLTTGKLLIVYS